MPTRQRELANRVYKTIQTSGYLGALQLLVFGVLAMVEEGDITSGELDRAVSKLKGGFTRSGSSRLTELRDMGLIEFGPDRVCRETHQTVATHRISGQTVPIRSTKRVRVPRPSKKVLRAALDELADLMETARHTQGYIPSPNTKAVWEWLNHLVRGQS